MGNVQILKQGQNSAALTEFQKNKLIFDFQTFFDLNNDGYLSYKDFQWAKDRICQMSGWKINCEKYKATESLFSNIWASLVSVADSDNDGKITSNEWISMWEAYKRELVEKEAQTENFLEKFYSKHDPDLKKLKSLGTQIGQEEKLADRETEEKNKWAQFEVVKESEVLESTILPTWLYDYLKFRFDLLDRVGDGVIDTEEYEYVLSEFGIKEKDSKQAFLIFSHHLEIQIDFQYFVQLFEEYYLSDDPADLGNFVNGKLDFPKSSVMEVIEEEDDLEDEESQRRKIEAQFDLSLYKDDMMVAESEPGAGKDGGEVSELCSRIVVRIRKWRRRMWKSFKLNCLPNSAI